MNDTLFIAFIVFQVFLGTYVFLKNPDGTENKLFSIWLTSNVFISLIKLFCQINNLQQINSILVPAYISLLLLSQSVLSFMVFSSLFHKKILSNTKFLCLVGFITTGITSFIFLDYFKKWNLISNGVINEGVAYPIGGRLPFLIPMFMILSYTMIMFIGVREIMKKDTTSKSTIFVVMMGYFTVFTANMQFPLPEGFIDSGVTDLCGILLIVIFSYYIIKREFFPLPQYALDKTFNMMDDLFIVINNEGKIVKINAPALLLINKTNKETIKLSISDYLEVLKSFSEQKCINQIKKFITNSDSDCCKCEIKIKEKYYYFSVMRIKNGENLCGFNIFGKDVTTLVNSEMELKDTNRYLEEIIEAPIDGIVITDKGGIIVRCNNAAQKLFGYSKDEIVGMRPMDFIPPDPQYYLEGARIIERMLTTGEAAIFESAVLTKNGEIIPVEWSLNYFYNDKGETAGSTGICRDLRERKSLEHQLMQNSKLASLGQLSAGIAHELNNPLAGILGYSQYLHKKLSNKLSSGLQPEELTSIAERIKSIGKEAEKCKVIIENLLRFSRPAENTGKTLLDINEAIEETLELIEHNLFVQSIKVNNCLNKNIQMIYGNNYQLQQVFTNLFMNAMQAMPEGGTLSVVTGCTPKQEEYPELVYIYIIDTGEGISKDITNKIFDPFFTTKRPGKGTGLGLSVSYGIVKEHSGNIEVISEKGIGTAFIITFPVNSSSSVDEKPCDSLTQTNVA